MILDALLPCTASGSISQTGLQAYVLWARSQSFCSVLLWNRLGRGETLDVQEREELYTTWRGGLTPDQRILACIPAGGLAVSARIAVSEALQAQEIGVDGLVLCADAENELHDALRNITVPVYESKGSGFNFTADMGNHIPVCYGAICPAEVQAFVESKPTEQHSQLLLWKLEFDGVLQPEDANDRALMLEPNERQQLRQLLRLGISRTD